MRLRAYAWASVALGIGVLLRALNQRSNFYSACVFLAQSNANLMILTNLVLLGICTILLGLQKLLYGPLRPIETEQLYEKAWFAITETCLAMTIFRGEVGGWFIVMFVCLLVGKVWGWIGEGRVEILEQQPPANPRLFHTRLSISLSISLLFDYYMLLYCVETVLRQARPDMMVMFGFEFAVLSITSTSTAARYAISLTEIYIIMKQKRIRLEERRRELREAREAEIRQHDQSSTGGHSPEIPAEEEVEEMDLDVVGWDDKGRYVFYLDLATDFLKLVVYLSFFFILLTFYGLPIHIMRDVFLTIRSFFKRIADFVRYRNATKDMNDRYPDATAAEISREDTCIICREDMTAWEVPAAGADAGNAGVPRRPPSPMAERMRPKKLPCGHILHFACLRSWLERQQNCPTCRRPVLVTNRITVAPANPQAQNNNAQGGAAQPPPQFPGANPPPAGNAAVPGQNRARIINLGPFRIGFGAGRGNLFQDLAQQVHDGGRAPLPAGNDAGPQQIGFGFGFGRPQAQPNPVPPAQPPTTSIENQLAQVEQQLMREVFRLQLTTEQIRLIRDFQGQFARLQLAQRRQTNGEAATPIANATVSANATTNGHNPNRLRNLLHGSRALPAGDPDLPEGLTLPDGWTLMPLHRSDGSAARLPPPATTAGASTANEQNLPIQGQPNSPPSQNLPVNAAQDSDLLREVFPDTPSASHVASVPAPLSLDEVAQDPTPDVPLVSEQPEDSSIPDPSSPVPPIPDAIGPQNPLVLPNGQPLNLPHWGTAEDNESASQVHRGQEEWVNISKDKSALESQDAGQDRVEGSSAEPQRSQDKGKGRAATVEDFIDDVD